MTIIYTFGRKICHFHNKKLLNTTGKIKQSESANIFSENMNT